MSRSLRLSFWIVWWGLGLVEVAESDIAESQGGNFPGSRATTRKGAFFISGNGTPLGEPTGLLHRARLAVRGELTTGFAVPLNYPHWTRGPGSHQ